MSRIHDGGSRLGFFRNFIGTLDNTENDQDGGIPDTTRLRKILSTCNKTYTKEVTRTNQLTPEKVVLCKKGETRTIDVKPST